MCITVSLFPVLTSWVLSAPRPFAVLHLTLCKYIVVGGSYFRGGLPPLLGLWCYLQRLLVSDCLQAYLSCSCLLCFCTCLKPGGGICVKNEAAKLMFSPELITEMESAPVLVKSLI